MAKQQSLVVQVDDRQVTYLTRAREALQRATEASVVKKIADAAAAAEVYARRQQLSEETIGLAHALKIDALTKLGTMLANIEKSKGRSGPGRGKAGTAAGPAFTEAPTLAVLGIDKKTSMVAQQLAALDEPTRQAIADREQTLTEALRTFRHAQRPPVDLPAGTYRVIYADPPWHYGNSGAINDDDSWGRAERHYPTMTIADLCALDIKRLAAPNAVLFLWVTSPLLAECWPVITAWGFTYKTSMIWDKVAPNYGFYVSVRHELLLICTRGSCLPDRPVPMPDSVMTIERSRTHSEKPDAFRAVIDQLYTGGADQKLELFARRDVPGWTVHGNETDRLRHVSDQ